MCRNNKSKQKNSSARGINYWAILGISVAVAIIFWVLAFIATHFFNFCLTNDQIVATIAGVLATFVVVGNYAQVQEIRHDFEKKVDELKLQQTEITKSQTENKNLVQVWNEARSDAESLTIAYRLLKNPNKEVSVVTADTPYKLGKTQKALWRMTKDEKLEFYTTANPTKKIDDILMVDELDYNGKYVETLLKLLMENNNQSPKVQEGNKS